MLLTNRKKVAAAFGALLLSPVMAGSVFAQAVSGLDDKSMSGGACMPAMQAAYSDFDVRANSIQNRSPGYRWVACSLISDAETTWETGDLNGGTDSGRANFRVYVRYGGTSGSTNCTWQVINALGTVLETASDSVNGTAGTNHSLASGQMYLGGADGRAVGVNCLIPPGARLHYINWEEGAATHQNTVY